LLAFRGAPAEIFEKAAERLAGLLPADTYTLADSSPDILFFLSGGSEQEAIRYTLPSRFLLLIGSRHGNAYASATEVKAYLDHRKIPAMLLDEEEEETREMLRLSLIARNALKNLCGKKLGLIGEVSEWLIASTVPVYLLQSVLGIWPVKIPWSGLPPYSQFDPSPSLPELFDRAGSPGLTGTARVHAMLEHAIRQHGLDAITVECFPMVKRDHVTACLSLAKFNHEGFPAGCEGDLASAAGMMLCRELTGTVPWMANINKVTAAGCHFSHCTIAPGLVTDFTVTTHFETGEGTAIAGDFNGDRVTVFRFDNQLGQAFIATGEITERPRSATACRTQIVVKLDEEDAQTLKEHPLGNHHLILPGDHTRLLYLTCLVIGIGVQA